MTVRPTPTAAKATLFQPGQWQEMVVPVPAAADIQVMVAAMAVVESAIAAAAQVVIQVPAATETPLARVVAEPVVVATQAHMAIPAVEAQDLLDKDLVAVFIRIAVEAVAVVVKAVVVVKILGLVTVTDRLMAASMAVVQVKVATAAPLADTRYIEVVEDVFVSSGEQEEAFLQQAQEICNVTIING